jgi:hypothetical protein
MNTKRITSIALLIMLVLCSNSLMAQNILNLKSKLVPTYDKWLLSDSLKAFNQNNLYDYIDGAADNYLSCGFVELLVATYNKTEDKYISVEIYKHESAITAFGIYAQERPNSGKFSKIGAQGYQEGSMLNFFCDNFYVKLSSHDNSNEGSALLVKMGTNLASTLSDNAELPKSLQFLPAEAKIANSEALINTNFMGYEFMKSALLACYGSDKNVFKVFIMESKSKEIAGNMIQTYMTTLKLPFDGKEGVFTVKDPHNGDIKLEWKGNYIWGILNDKNVKINKDYLQLTKDLLTASNAI